MRSRFVTLLAVLLLTLASCGGAVPVTPSVSVTASPFPATLTDFQNRSVTVPARPERLVSIGPSVTAFLFALGAGPRVVGVDDFSDEPAEAATREHVGGIKVNFEKVVALKPDLVLSVKFSDGTIEKLQAASLNVLVVDPQSVSDVARTATLLGKAVDADGEALARSIQQRVDAVKAKTASVTTRPRVYHEIDASDPAKIFTVGPGSYINDLIDIAGGVNVAARAPSAYPQLSAEEILRSDPEIIVLAAADYSAKPSQVAARQGWSIIAAVKSGRIVTIEPNLINRPGPRVGEAAEAYARLVHPELFR
jgi:iron complex transport system substrate-binding protein